MERTRANFKGNGSFQSLIYLIPGASSRRLNIVQIQIIDIIRRLDTMLKIFTIALRCFGNALFQPVPDMMILSTHKDGGQSMAYLRYREDADYLHRLYHWKQRSPFRSDPGYFGTPPANYTFPAHWPQTQFWVGDRQIHWLPKTLLPHNCVGLAE